VTARAAAVSVPADRVLFTAGLIRFKLAVRCILSRN